MNILLIVQIITEVLPISSSTHMRLFYRLFAAGGNAIPFPTRTEVWSAHAPTLCVVLFAWRARIGRLMRDPLRAAPVVSRLFFRVCLVTGGTLLTMLLVPEGSDSYWYDAMRLCGSAICLGIVGFCSRGGTRTFGWHDGIMLALVQGGSARMLPTSRLGAVYTTYRVLGFSHRHAWAGSWMLGLPLYLGALFCTYLQEGGLSSLLVVIGSPSCWIAGAVSYGLWICCAQYLPFNSTRALLAGELIGALFVSLLV